MLLARLRAVFAAALVALVTALPAAAGAVTLPFKASAQQGVFLHLSDIHFDPFIDAETTSKLAAAPVEQWQSIFEHAQDGSFSPRGHDTNYPLFASMLSAAQGPPYDYVLNTGDNLAHGFRQKFDGAHGTAGDYQSFVIKTLLFVDRMLKQSFPGAPLIYSLGNNDAVCGDYMLAPDGALLAQVGRDLPVIAGNGTALRDFTAGGFYIVPHPTVPRHDMIVLNSILWSAEYHDKCSAKGGDPGSAELDWLAWTLYREKLVGRTATLVMHIPPGIDAYSSSRESCPQSTSFWQTDYTRRFRALIDAYPDVLRTGYAGHTHMDDFRVLSAASGKPLLALRISPAVSPVFGNNPAFTVLLYDRADATVKDFAGFSLTNLEQAGGAVPGKWALEYDFGKTYGAQDFTPARMAALAQNIRSEESVRHSFVQYYGSDVQPSPIENNWRAFACAQTGLTPDAYAACRCPGKVPH